jgi:predicted amidophosphoribosyltransferase
MYKCSSCGEIFEEPEIVSEKVGEIGCQSAYQDYEVCPNCGEDGYFEEIHQCEMCGEYADLEDGFCEDCIDKTRKEFMSVWDEFSEEQREILKYLELVGEAL